MRLKERRGLNTTKPARDMAESRAHVPGECEARMLLVLGASAPDVHAATGLSTSDAQRLADEIRQHGKGPYSADAAARMIGVAYRTVYHLIEGKTIKSRKRKAV